jgi:hypothetical protein
MGIIAFDEACDPAYNGGWPGGSNGGFGFGAWNFTAYSVTKYLTGLSNLNGLAPIGPGIDCSTPRSWELRNPTTLANAWRSLPNPAQGGDFFCVKFDNSDALASAQSHRIALSTAPTAGFSSRFYPDPATATYHLLDGSGDLDTGVIFDTGGTHCQWSMVDNVIYNFLFIRLSDGFTFTVAGRAFENPSPTLFTATNQGAAAKIYPRYSVYINEMTYANSSGGYSGCAGDPHFVGFDGVAFNYHGNPGEKYLLFEQRGLRVEALFDLEDKIKDEPMFKDSTFIKELYVTQGIGKNKVTTIYKAYDPVEKFKEHNIIESKTGLARGIPKELAFIGGRILGGDHIEFPGGSITVSLFQIRNEARHLNVSMSLDSIFNKADGIIGQTTMPKYLRKPNESFLLNGNK